MTGSSTQGIKNVLHPVSDLAAAKAVHGALLGVAPQTDGAYDVGFEDDRVMGERIHELITTTAPSLVPKTYYGMPAYAKDGKVICFYKPASKFKVRYSTFEFQADARLDDGDMWPVSFAVIELTPRTEARIVDLVKKAVS